MGQVPSPQPTAQTATEIRRTPVLIPDMQALVTCTKERFLVDWLAMRYGRMDGQSVIGWIARWPDSLTFDRPTDQPTDRMRNKPAGKPTTDHPSDQSTDDSKQTNHPTGLL